MEGKKTILFLANGFGIEAKGAYSLYGDETIQTVNKLSQEYMFTSLLAGGRECGFTEHQVSNYRLGYQCFSSGGYTDLAVKSMDKRIAENNFIDEKMIKSIEFATKNNSKMHIFFMVGDKFSYSTSDQLKAFVKECLNHHVKEVCIHLFIGYNSQKGLKIAKDSIKMIDRGISQYENVNISLIVGVDLASDSTPVGNLAKLYKIATTSISETWNDWQQLLNLRYSNGIPDEKITPFLTKRRTLLESNDSIFIFNYEPMPITRYLSIIINPNQLFNVDTNPTNLMITSLLPIQEGTSLAHAYEYDMPTEYFTKDLEMLNKKATLIADSSRAAYINSILNGKKNELSPFLETKSVRINNDYFAEMTQILINEIASGTNEVIIIDFNLLNDYKKGDFDKVKYNVGQMDKALRKVYEYTYSHNHCLIFTSLYGFKEEGLINNENVLINYSEKMPFIVVDNVYTRNTAVIQPDTISLISQTLLFMLGKKCRTIVLLRKKKGGNKLIILIAILIAIMYIVGFILLKV